jgi:site-specific recombinase XerD
MGALLYIEEFLAYQQASGRALATRRRQRITLRRLGGWLEEQGIEEEEVKLGDLVRFVNHEGGRVSPNEVNNTVSAIRVYFRWLTEEEILPGGNNPAIRLRYQKVPLKPVESLTEEECRKLVRWATAKTRRERFGTYRTGILAVFLLDTGMRLGEALGLALADVNLQEGKALIRATKTGGFRVVPLSESLRNHLRRYLRRRERLLKRKGRECDRLFISESGTSAEHRTVEMSFTLISEKAGIRPVHPHLLRHTFATQSLLNGAPLPAVMRLGGWKRLATVQRYTYMNDEVAGQVHAQTSPLSKL